jgi:hypothetical protein
MKQCPKCKSELKQLNFKHIKNCFGNDPTYKIQYINHNFPLTRNVDFLRKSYIEDQDSLPILCEKVGGLDLKNMSYVLTYNNIDVRTIKETRSIDGYKNRIKSTNLGRYGKENPLCKGTEPFEKRNNTVLEKYGVENVWQCIDQFVNEFGSNSKISKLNKKIYNILNENGIKYDTEYPIKYTLNSKLKFKSFDIRIENLLIEINGDYWHANPNLYKPDTIFQFPKNSLTSEEIWEMDKYKKEIAESQGYKVVYIWENFIKKSNDGEILQYIIDQIDKKD